MKAVWAKKGIRMMIVLTAAMALAFVSGQPAQAENGDLADEVRSYAEVYRISEDEVIAAGVTIGGVDVGGMTLTEAAEAVANRQQEMLSRTVSLTLDSVTEVYSMEELGLKFVNPSEEVVKAASLGKSGTILERYKFTKDLENHGYEYEMTYYVDRGTVEQVIAAFAEGANQPAVEATITRSNGEFIVTEDQTGIAVNEEATLAQVLTAVQSWDGTANIVLTAEGEITEPVRTYEALSTISDVLGAFKTICGDLTTNRGQNVIIGASKLNGNVVMPGESFSVVSVLAPFTVENGYKTAVAYIVNADGVPGYMDDIGGGVCSLSTTLYNALLRAELQIDKRWNHSMIVSYVDWGFDSTVNDDGSRDLVFTNNYDTPVYIEAYAVYGSPDGWLYFNVYGKETRDMSRRTLKFYNKILESEYPTAEEYRYVVDTSLAPGQEVWDQGSYPYAKVQAYKEVYIDGVLVEKTMLSEDTYRKSSPIIRHNPGTETEAAQPAGTTPPPAPQPETQAPETTAPETQAPETTGAPETTEAPQTTEAPENTEASGDQGSNSGEPAGDSGEQAPATTDPEPAPEPQPEAPATEGE